MLAIPHDQWQSVFDILPALHNISHVSKSFKLLRSHGFKAILFATKTDVKIYLARISVKAFTLSQQKYLVSLAVNNRNTTIFSELIKFNSALKPHLRCYLVFAIRRAALALDFEQVRYLVQLKPALRRALDYPFRKFQLNGEQTEDLVVRFQREFGSLSFDDDKANIVDPKPALINHSKENEDEDPKDPLWLTLAAQTADISKLKRLLEQGANVNGIDEDDECPLLGLATYQDRRHPDDDYDPLKAHLVLSLLLEYGVNFDAIVNGTPLLIKFILAPDTSFLLTLLEFGAQLNGRDTFGRTLLSIATLQRRTEAVKLLLMFGADPTPNTGAIEAFNMPAFQK
jgi:hypothetical protein